MEAWRYEIQHGPDGEADYAWVYDASGTMVCTAKTHFAMQIVEAINRRALSAVGGEAGETWETFCDHAYYDLWAVRRTGSTIFNDAFHVQSKDEAEALAAILNASPLARLKAQRGVVKALRTAERALRPLYNRVFNDNGDLTTDMSPLSATEINDGYFAYREIERALAAPVSQEPVAEQIADAVLSWMVKFDLLDADNEYGPEDVLAVLNDLAPAERPITEGEPVAVSGHPDHTSPMTVGPEAFLDEPLTVERRIRERQAATPGSEDAVVTAGETAPLPLSEGEPSDAEVELDRALKDVLSSLVAAHSLLSRSPKTAAPSNKMFDQMLKDYAASIKRGRAALLAAKSKGGQADE